MEASVGAVKSSKVISCVYVISNKTNQLLNSYLLQFIISLIFVIVLSSCGGNDDELKNENKTFIQVPGPLQKLNVDRGALSAYVTLDGAITRTQMDIDSSGGGTASVVLSGLTRTEHNIVITYEYTDELGILVLAEFKDVVDLSAGSKNINIAAENYLFNFDADGDRDTNITELLEGTDPRVSNTISTGVALTVVADVPKLSDTAISTGNLQAFVTLDDNNERIPMIINNETGVAKVTIPNLTQVQHVYTVVFEYTDNSGILTVATITDNADLTFSGGEFNVNAQDYELLKYDNDGDGTSNALELLAGSDPRVKNAPVAAATLKLTFEAVKTISLNWVDVEGATIYRVLENIDGISGLEPIGGDIAAGVQRFDHEVSLLAHLKAKYILQSCNEFGCINGDEITIKGSLGQAVTNLNVVDVFRFEYSGDANILAANTGLTEISLFRRVGGDFDLLGTANKRIFSSDLGPNQDGDYFGVGTVGLSRDGGTLVVSAPGDDAVTPESGAIYVFGKNGNEWLEQAYIKEIVPKAFNVFGNSVALSGDGNTLVYIADGCNDYQNIGGTPVNATALDSRAAYVYVRNGNNEWNLQACIKASNSDGLDSFGLGASNDVFEPFDDVFALSEDGLTLVVGAMNEDGGKAGIQQGVLIDDNNATNSGVVYVFVSNGSVWEQQAYIKAGNAEAGDRFGEHIELNGNGNVLVVSALEEDGGNRDDTSDNSMLDAGAVYVFERDGVNWLQQDYIKPNNIDAIGSFGVSISLNYAGDFLAIGDPNENSNSVGVGGDASNEESDSGALYLFKRKGSWRQEVRIKANSPVRGAGFGAGFLSDDGSVLIEGGLRLY